MYFYFVESVQTVHPNFTDNEVKEQMQNLLGNARKRWEKLQPNYVPPTRTKRKSDMQTQQFCAANTSSTSGDRSVNTSSSYGKKQHTAHRKSDSEARQFCTVNTSSTSGDRSVNASSSYGIKQHAAHRKSDSETIPMETAVSCSERFLCKWGSICEHINTIFQMWFTVVGCMDDNQVEIITL